MAEYTTDELSDHAAHTVLSLDVVGCRICDAVAQQRGSLLDNDQLHDDEEDA